MITLFPDPYPDELLYSVCARYQERMMWGNQKTTLEDLFGSDTVGLTWPFGRLGDPLATRPSICFGSNHR